MVTFSIIVPVYNVEKYLEKCINSILNQSFSDYELILVDDGSTDNSLSICEYFVALNDKVNVIHQNNGGLSSARNVGLNKASGKYIVFIDSDDFVSLNMLSNCYNILSCDEKIDILNFGYRKVTEDGNLICNRSYDKPDLTVREALIEILMDRNINSFAWSNIYKRELFKDISFPVNTYFEDKYTTYRIYDRAKKVIVVPEQYYNYLVRPGSICNEKQLSKIIKGLLDNGFALLEQYNFAVQKDLNEVFRDLGHRINATFVSMLRTLYKYKYYNEIQIVYERLLEFQFSSFFNNELIFFLHYNKIYSFLMCIYRIFK